jgi:hypothetical protein
MKQCARIRQNCSTGPPQSPLTVADIRNEGPPMLPNLKIWLNHFEYHSEHPRRIPPGVSNELTASERHLIARSIATFQLGEQSSGSNLLRAADHFARERDAPEVARITELLIKEEQQHATLLRSFMASHGIPTLGQHWTDRLFRRARSLAELELALSVLVTAELIGNVYYRSLEATTGCQRLRWLCRALVADELAHVGFESDLLLCMRADRTAAVRAVIDVTHRTFFLCTAGVVWATHRPVLRQAGFGLFGFLQACWMQYQFYLIKPYRWSARANRA